MVETNEITVHELKVIRVLRAQPELWMTHVEICAAVEGVSLRTVRWHTLRLTKLGLLDVIEAFPRHLYRWSEMAEKRNRAYVQRVDAVAAAMGDRVR